MGPKRSTPLLAILRSGAYPKIVRASLGCRTVQQSIQETLYPFSTCFGCGPSNSQGLHLRSYEDDGAVVANFRPGDQHSNGMGSLNGGVIATLLDCHSGAAVFLNSARASETSTTFRPWVTTGLELRYRLPTFLDGPSDLWATVLTADDAVMTVKATLSYEGKVRVQAESRWVRVAQG